jgi:hypothetical protein
MSQFEAPVVGGGRAVEPLRRPRALIVALFASVLAAVLGLGGAATLIAGAKHLAEQTTADVAGTADPAVLGSPVLHQAVVDATSTLTARGWVGVVAGVLVLLFVLVARNGAMWARLILGLALLLAVCANALAVADVVSAASKVMDVLAIFSCLVAIVIALLPASGRYAKARKNKTA